MIPVVVAVIFLVYGIMYMTPGDPVAVMLGADATPELIQETREKLGITDPFLVQFANYVKNLFTGHFGTSWYTGRDVSERLFAAIPYTIKLSLLAMLVALVLSIPMGVLAAVKHNSLGDYTISIFAMIGVSAPTFWVGTMLMLLCSLSWGILPSAYDGTWKSYVLPTITQGFNMLASVTRTQRSSMLEVLSADYIRTARAKGLSERVVILKHALKNALIPVITVVGLQIGLLFGGAILTETVFAWPGVGRLMIDSIRAKDTPVVQGGVIFTASIFVFINLLVDILYAYVDPRVKAQYKS